MTKRATKTDEAALPSTAVGAASDPVNQVNPDKIALRAYEIFQARGSSHGSDVDDWLKAERELAERGAA